MTNKKSKLPNMNQLLMEGIKARQGEHEEAEVEKIGGLRGGSCGLVLTSDGDMSSGFDITGACPMAALARMSGVGQGRIEPHTHLLFEAGYTNEDSWDANLKHSWVKAQGGVVVAEEECPVVWELPSGTKVTGRPDGILIDSKGKEVVGLEHKQVASVWTARSFLVTRKPKMGHLIQAAHYSHQKGLPWKLIYTSRVNWACPPFGVDQFPQPGEPGSEHLQWTYGQNVPNGTYMSGKKKGQTRYTFRKIDVPSVHQGMSLDELERIYGVTDTQLRGINPFCFVFDMKWEDGHLHWSPEDENLWQKTPITWEGIEQFYQLVDDMARNLDMDLPETPILVEADGSLSKKYDPCGYCSVWEEHTGNGPEPKTVREFLERFPEWSEERHWTIIKEDKRGAKK